VNPDRISPTFAVPLKIPMILFSLSSGIIAIACHQD
jgi:hypothetical protein